MIAAQMLEMWRTSGKIEESKDIGLSKVILRQVYITKLTNINYEMTIMAM